MFSTIQIAVVVAVFLVAGCSVAPQQHAKCSFDSELQLFEQDRFEEARAHFMLRDSDPGAILALTLMSEWRIGAPVDTVEYRQRWEDLSSPAQELGTSSLLICGSAGNVGAQMLIGIAYYTGIGVNADLESAKKFFGVVDPAIKRNSIGLIGSAAVAHATGQQHTADALLELATSKPIVFSEYSVGAAFYLGIIFKKDYTQAAKWLRRAADKGDPRAQGTLGYMYALGRGVERDDHQAQYWLERQRSSTAPSFEDAKPIVEGYWEKEKGP